MAVGKRKTGQKISRAKRSRSPHTGHAISGVYVPDPARQEGIPASVTSLTLRLDVDGWYPQQVFSITVEKKRGKKTVVLFNVTARTARSIKGAVSRRWGGTHPFGKEPVLQIVKPRRAGEAPVVLVGSADKGSKSVPVRLRRTAETFRSVDFESDHVKGMRMVTEFDPASHPVHHASFSGGTINVGEIYRRAGIRLNVASEHSVVPVTLSGADQAWSKRELHDAMQSYWSHYSKNPQWSMWVLFADRYAESAAVAGMMFDTSHKEQRRGVALFNKSMLFTAPPGDVAPSLWKKRMQFFTICHEIGHVFNLAHSWEKSSGNGWIRMKNNPLADSFMNHPHFYENGCEQFFRDFTFRFDDGELLFMRHAPEEFVEMGNSAWFENHALSLDNRPPEKELSFVIRTGRARNRYQYMEPVVIECRIANTSGKSEVVDIDEAMLADRCSVTVRRCGDGKTVRIAPFTSGDYVRPETMLASGESLYGSMFVSVDTTGWVIAEPGVYEISAEVTVNKERLVSNLLPVEVVRPRSKHLETVARDYFSVEVGRVLAFDGSTVLDRANDILHRCCGEDIPEAVAVHARIALALPKQGTSKQLNFVNTKHAAHGRKPEVASVAGDHRFSADTFRNVFLGSGSRAAATLGNIDFRKYADVYCGWLVENGRHGDALSVQEVVYNTLVGSGVKKRRILDPVEEKLRLLRSGKSSWHPKNV